MFFNFSLISFPKHSHSLSFFTPTLYQELAAFLHHRGEFHRQRKSQVIIECCGFMPDILEGFGVFILVDGGVSGLLLKSFLMKSPRLTTGENSQRSKENILNDT